MPIIKTYWSFPRLPLPFNSFSICSDTEQLNQGFLVKEIMGSRNQTQDNFDVIQPLPTIRQLPLLSLHGDKVANLNDLEFSFVHLKRSSHGTRLSRQRFRFQFSDLLLWRNRPRLKIQTMFM